MNRSLLSVTPLFAAFTQSLVAQTLDYSPSASAVLSTDGAVVTATNGTQVAVPAGVFQFRNVVIPAGVTIRGTGRHPMIWIVDTLVVDGTLDASGENGTRVNTLNSANFPAPGGRGGPAAGRGGAGSPQVALRSLFGMSGTGPDDTPGYGGTGGICAFPPVVIGSGGGGGAFATVGDSNYKFLAPGGASTSFVQQLGLGGFGGSGQSGASTRTLIGRGPGGVPFVDGDDENDFVGRAFDVNRNRFVNGELDRLVGGSGGGGGGDHAGSSLLLDPNFAIDNKGGGGGGGGGFLAVVATTQIVVSPTGHIRCNGGHGGGGEPAGSSTQGGGGGGGSGGVLVLASFGTIDLHVKGETYANNDYDFVVSADGGISLTGQYVLPDLEQKYALTGTTGIAVNGQTYDSRPLGGFGGMGIVELAVPMGSSNADGTNTVLDDNIRLFQSGAQVFGATKQRFLAWRGWKDAAGVRVDDAGVPTNIGSNEGDIRPAPILVRL